MSLIRTCSRCREEKKLTEFNKSVSGKDGYTYVCTACNRKASRQHAAKNRLRYQEEGVVCLSKRCSRCKEDLSSDEFHRNPSTKDGLTGYCKQCSTDKSLSPKGKYASYKSSAKVRGYKFELTFNEFKSFWRQPCHYCGQSIDTIGLDRVNNNMSYHVNNVVPCCTQCNQAKMDYTESEFFARIKRIYELHNLGEEE